MTFRQPGIYHVYNRGNFKQPVFYTDEHYLYFLKKCHKYLPSCSDVLAWCLMPNHFHFLLNISLKSLDLVKVGGMMIPAISNGFRILQSSYAKGINKELHRTGNLFQQKTKSALITDLEEVRRTFRYIHENPVAAGLVKRPEEWKYSSYVDYIGLRSGTLCYKKRAYELLGSLYLGV